MSEDKCTKGHATRRNAEGTQVVDFVPAVQWALNTVFRERYAGTSYHVIFGRTPSTSFATLPSSMGEEWKVDVLDTGELQKKVKDVVKE